MTDVTIIFTGWGRNGWGSGGFGAASSSPPGEGEVGQVTVVEGQGTTVPLAGFWVGGAWSEGSWGNSVSPGLTSSVGTVNVVVRYAVTGLEAEGQVGAVTAEAGADVPPTGLEAEGQVGTLTPGVGSGASVRFDGWGRGTWGEAAWGVSLGVFATGQVGQLGYVGGVDVPTTGLEATGEVDSVTATGGTGVTVNVTGLEATGEVDSVTATGDANVNVTGIAPEGQVGTATAAGIAKIFVTGLSATGQVSVPAVEGDASTSVTGLGTSGEVGSVLVWDRIDPDATVVWTEIAA